MYYTKDHKTGYLFDPWEKILGKKRRHLMETSWAGFFRRDVLVHLPVEKLKKHFCDNFGRPTKELFVVCGVLILQQTLDLSDEETISQLAFNLQWHYALDITDLRTRQPICARRRCGICVPYLPSTNWKRFCSARSPESLPGSLT